MPQSGYSAGPPWTFVGRAWYQLTLVKASLAKQLIPPELDVVEAFGYTLGGMYYAEYDDSPAGKFNELVVIPGIVWNPPTSCAWAASVIVDSDAAKLHGIKAVGLPSRLATFLQPKISDVSTFRKEADKRPQQRVEIWAEPFPPPGPLKGSLRKSGSRKSPKFEALCSLRFPHGVGSGSKEGFSGLRPPKIALQLPSFSGKTQQHPEIIRYSCQLDCRVTPCSPVTVTPLAPDSMNPSNEKDERRNASTKDASTARDLKKSDGHRMPSKADVLAILSSRPIAAFQFQDMTMVVGAPVPAFPRDAALHKSSRAKESLA